MIETLSQMSAQEWGVVLAFVTGIFGLVAAIISRYKNKEELGAISTGALATLAGRVTEMNESLAEAEAARLDDCMRFEKDIEDLRTFYRHKLLELEVANAEAIKKLQAKNTREIDQLRVYYEGKIERIEQAHRDRVNSLKERIKVLENGSGIHR
jgi:hypothetical protein